MKDQVILDSRNVKFTVARFLSEQEQAQYEEACKKYSIKARINLLNIGLEGSNLYKVLLLNQQGVRIAGLSGLDKVVESDKEFLAGFHVDVPAVVLRSEGDSYEPNDRLAKYLAKKAKQRGFNLEKPVVINELKLVNDNNSAYGLAFKVGEETGMFEAPELADENNKKIFLRLDERGMPIFDANGDRILYTRDKGLSRLYLGGGMNLYSGWGNLAFSGSIGRVVVVDAEGATNQK